MAETVCQLEYENQMFLELVSEDGLLILAKGLGIDRLFLKLLKLYSDPHNLVLAIGTSPNHEKYFNNELIKQGVNFIPKSISNQIAAKERQSIYLEGGVLYVTSRILVVDMLKMVCPLDKVSGILVYNAHRVNDVSNEAFILRLYKDHNKDGFVKGLSDSPELFTSGFCQLERIMKNLFVRQVYIWPRFHAVVGATLDKHQPDVIELRQQMSHNMILIQQAILDIMKTCIKELKTCNKSLEMTEVTIDNCLSKSFDQIVKLQFDPIWNQLSFKAKQLIWDLKMLRTLLYFLTQYDCVTFYSYLMSLRSNKKGTQAFSDNSPWIFTDSANTLFSKSRERVYGEEKDNDKSKYFSNRLPYLEESPKWHLLSIVLDEIKREREGRITQDAPSDTVLILANDERTCYQLKEYLCSGGKGLLQRLFERFLGGKNRIDMTDLPDEMKKHLMPSKTKGRYDKDGPPLSKRAKEEEEKGDDDDDVTGVDTEIFSNFQLDDISMRPNIDDEGPGDFRLLQEPLIIIHSLNNSKDPCHLMKVLSSNKPRTIIMYDADIKLTREIEIFKASHCNLSLRVYFLIYDSSVEEQKYLSVIKKEKETFQQLIYEKAHMVIPADREGRCDDNSTVKRGSSDKPIESNNSRKAGGQKQSSSSGDGRPSVGDSMVVMVINDGQVIVDMREFRSSLPSLIHKRGIDVIPLTIEVGDYILSPDICIERKSLADLIGSLNSGRLYNQAKAMTQHYKKSVLLIEFEEGQPFSLQSYNAVVGDVHSHSVAAKLVLLTIHFPKLRILWCPSPHFAAEMFEKLKIGQPQPDLTSAIISKSESFGLEGEQLYNPTLQDFLLKLPGINIKNYKYVMDNVVDLQDLIGKTRQELEKILGNDVNAKLLWDCLHAKPPQITSTSNRKKSATSKGRNL